MIEDRYDKQRGCGWRKEGGLYMIGGSLMSPCGKLPIPLTVCPCCNAGIKPTRGFTWVGKALVMNAYCLNEKHAITCRHCPPFDGSVDKLGLVWIGGSFYRTPDDFMREARDQGISRRIPAVPNDFIVGESWVLLAHREGMRNPDKSDGSLLTDIPDKIPAIFSAFCPTHIEYIVKGDESEEDIERMEKRGITCVRVHKTGPQVAILNNEDDS